MAAVRTEEYGVPSLLRLTGHLVALFEELLFISLLLCFTVPVSCFC